MKRIVTGLLAAALLAVAGCGPSNQTPSAAADLPAAKAAVSQALDSWQAGGAIEALQQASPAIFVTDHDWSAGKKLTGYKLGAEPVLHGNQARFDVVLQLTSGKQKAKPVRAVYLVGTQPIVSISRSDIDE